MAERIHRIENFIHGQIDTAEGKSAPAGSASRSLNWMTLGDKIELRRGQARRGADDGAGKVTGLSIAFTDAGVEVGIKSHGRKINYYDEGLATPAWTEIGTNLILAAANGEDQFFAAIRTLAGAQLWNSSPLSGLVKIMVNGGKSTTVAPHGKDNYDSTKNYAGRIKARLNRLYSVGYTKDKSGFRGSYIDRRNYTTVSNESLGTGDAVTKTFSGTLAAVTGKRTCFAIVVDAVVVGGATETFSDNRDGTLTSNLGGTGTINYSTGAISVTFFTAPDTGQGVLADYQWEDSTNQGLADFTESATRTAGQGFYLPQGDGGENQSVESYEDSEYCLHQKKTWVVQLTNDDTNATNLIFRELAGIPYARASVSTGDGIYFVDDRDETDVRIRLLTLDPRGSAKVVPLPVSTNINLNNFRFDKAVGYQFGDFIIFECRTPDSVDSAGAGVNNRMLVLNKAMKKIQGKLIRLNAWDVLDYFATCFTIKDGALWGGHPLNNNVYELFSGFDDDGSTIDNYWEGNWDEMGIPELKRSRSVRIEGDIHPDQDIEVYIGTDFSGYALVGTVNGDNGEYVDLGSSVAVGTYTLGKTGVGGSSSQDIVNAHHYYAEIELRRTIDRFQRYKIKFVATGVGYASVSSYEFFDISLHGRKVPSKYQVTP